MKKYSQDSRVISSFTFADPFFKLLMLNMKEAKNMDTFSCLEKYVVKKKNSKFLLRKRKHAARKLVKELKVFLFNSQLKKL